MPVSGAWKIAAANGVGVPAFAFEVPDLAVEEKRIGHHFISLVVAVDPENRPYLRVEVPDIEYHLGVAGPFDADAQVALDAAQLELAANVIVIGDREREADLSAFGVDVTLDYSGELGRAIQLDNAGHHRDALEKIAPLLRREVAPTGAFWQAARATATLGAPLEALDLHDREIASCTNASGDIIPAASLAFNSKGVLYKKLDRLTEAAAMFESALRLRPNFFEALITSSTLFVTGPQAAVDRIPVLLARALRIRPTSPVFVQLIPMLARELATDATQFHRRLETLAAKTDLGKPLFSD